MRTKVKTILMLWLMCMACLSLCHAALTVTSIEANRSLSQLTICFSKYEHIDIPKNPDDAITVSPSIDDMTIHSTYWGEWIVTGKILPHQLYTITIKAGVSTHDGKEKLEKDIVYVFKTPDMMPNIKILSSGPFYPSSRNKWLFPLQIQAGDSITTSIQKVYNHNVIPYSYDDYDNHSRLQFIKDITVPVSIPKDTSIRYNLDLSEVIPDRQNGIYYLTFTIKDSAHNERYDCTSAYVILSDLGIATAEDDSHRKIACFVHSLKDSHAVSDVTVKAFSRNNCLIAEGKTDQDGKVLLSFSDDFDSTRDSIHVITAETENDFTFIETPRLSSHNLSIFNNNGLHFTNSAAAFVYSSRDIIRPGESLEISSLIRNLTSSDLPPVAQTPVIVKITNPYGNTVQTKTLTTDDYGFVSHSFTFPETSNTGKYTIDCQLATGESIGTGSFIVSTFIPDRIRVSLSSSDVLTRHDSKLSFTVGGTYYYGNPVKNATCKFRVFSRIAPAPSHWGDYTVGDDTSFVSGQAFSYDIVNFDTSHAITYTGFNAMDGKSFNPVQLVATASIQEPGGRSVSESMTAISIPSVPFIGLKKVNGSDNDDSDNVSIAYEVLNYEKQAPVVPFDQPVTLELFSLSWHYTASVDSNGHKTYHWNQIRTKVNGTESVTIDGTKGIFSLKLPVPGEYELIASVGKDVRTRMPFYHWYGDGGARCGNPSILSFTTDKPVYKPGETARITFQSAAKGAAFIVSGQQHLDAIASAAVQPGDNTIELPIPSDCTATMYHSAITVVNHLDGNINRLFGMISLKIDQSMKKLSVSLQTSEVVRPQSATSVHASVTTPDGSSPEGILHLFAVDEGILSLTHFKTPSPFDFFHGKRFFEPRFCDIYGMIYPDLSIDDDGRIGGDIAESFAKKMGSVKMKKSAVIELDVLPIPPSGEVDAILNIPDHLGAMRIMGVASTRTLVGSADTSVIVRDAISIQSSGPRAVAPGDSLDLTFVLNNHDLAESDYQFSVSLPPSLSAKSPVTFNGKISKGASQTVIISAQVLEQLGAFDITSTLKIGGEEKRDSLPVTIRPLNASVAMSRNYMLKPGQELPLTFSPSEWISGTASGYVTSSAMPSDGLEESISWLNQYPYGCLEQTTSTAFPFLYLDELCSIGLIHAESIPFYRDKLVAARDRILSMQLSNGSFSLWPEHMKTCLEGSIFAIHFLAEAKRRGIDISQETLHKSLNYLLGIVNANYSREECAYSAYVLALSNDIEFYHYHSKLLRLLDHDSIDFATFIAAAAAIKNGHANQGLPLFHQALDNNVWLMENPSSLNMISTVSRMAMALTILMDIEPDHAKATELAFKLRDYLREDGKGWGTTQNNAWATAALAVYSAHFCDKSKPLSATYQLNHETPVEFNASEANRWSLEEGKTITFRNTGTAPVFFHVHTDAVPRMITPPNNRFLKIVRTYLNEKGEPMTRFKQGDFITVKLELTSAGTINNIVIADLLPGGLEIEDPLLLTRSAAFTEKQAEQYGILRPQIVERRDDRFLLFGDIIEAGTAVVTYKVRAVTRGHYGIPPSLAEAMYDPDLTTVFITSDPLDIE